MARASRSAPSGFAAGWLRDSGLSLALFGLFGASLIGQALTGQQVWNEELARYGDAPVTLGAYLRSGHFMSTLYENWESEFLQMGVYVILTAYLFQRGSPESRDPDKAAPQDRDPKADANNPEAPWPVRAGGLARTLYAHSLGAALIILFLLSFALHGYNSMRLARDESLGEGETPPSLMEHLSSANFWFESFQNWQSEFLSTGVLIVLAIFLRERRSPESKPVAAPHSKTGND